MCVLGGFNLVFIRRICNVQLSNIYPLFFGHAERVYLEEIELTSIKCHYRNNEIWVFGSNILSGKTLK